MDTNIAGGSGTRRLRERAVLVRNLVGAVGCRFKKTVLRRALVYNHCYKTVTDIFISYCDINQSVIVYWIRKNMEQGLGSMCRLLIGFWDVGVSFKIGCWWAQACRGGFKNAKLLEKSCIHDHKRSLLFSKEGPIMTFWLNIVRTEKTLKSFLLL